MRSFFSGISTALFLFFSFFGNETPLHGQDFTASLKAGNGQSQAYELYFGFSPSATDAYDPGIDIYHPPAPPPPSFDIALGWGTPLDRYFKQILLGDGSWTTHRYEIQLQYDANQIIHMKWMNAGWKDLMSSCTLQDPFGGATVNVDMLTDNQVMITNTAVTLLYLDVTPKWYPWEDLGESLAGAAGEPTLTGTGLLTPGNIIQIDLSNALPLAWSYLVVGLSPLHASFKGGALIPSPDLLVAPLTIDAAGELSLSAPWPPAVPPGVTFYFQHWIPDDTGPQGFTASNGLSGTSGP